MNEASSSSVFICRIGKCLYSGTIDSRWLRMMEDRDRMLAGFSDKLFPARFVGVVPMQNCGCDKLSHVLSNNVLATFPGMSWRFWGVRAALYRIVASSRALQFGCPAESCSVYRKEVSTRAQRALYRASLAISSSLVGQAASIFPRCFFKSTRVI